MISSSASSYGDCLITVSTSKDLDEDKAEDVGLYTAHAYAVLGVVEACNGTRLLQLKNPWASKVSPSAFSVNPMLCLLFNDIRLPVMEWKVFIQRQSQLE